VGILSKTWTNALYILQIGTKTMLVIVAAIIKVKETGTVGVYRQACSGIPLAVGFVGRDRLL